MKLFVLALFSLIIGVTAESKSEKSKTTTVKDQKSDSSAFLQKFSTPLNHDVNQRYGVKYGANGKEYRNEGLLRNYPNRNYDYNDDYEEVYLRNEGGPRALYNKPNIWGYSRNGGGLEGLVSHSYNSDPNVWGYSRNSAGKVRNMGGLNGYNGNSKNEGRQRNVEYGNTGLGKMGYGNMGNGKMGYGNAGLGQMGYGNMENGNILQNLKVIPLEPEYLGYVGKVEPQGRGIKGRYNFKLIGRRGLGFDKRTSISYGLTAPITPALLNVPRRKYPRQENHYYYYPKLSESMDGASILI